METQAQDASGYYVWEAAGKGFEIHIHLDVIDGLVAEVMRGFGAVPKRGAEVGGLLLGSVEEGVVTVVHIEDFEPVECGYTRGPSYLLSPDERDGFEVACTRWRPNASRSSSLLDSYAVGYYRSHTRDGMSLAPEDVELMDRCFPDPSQVALLVKPFATKASPAGFFFRENGVFQETTPLEFPFRRRELAGEGPPERRSLTERLPRDHGVRMQAEAVAEFTSRVEAAPVSDVPGFARAVPPPARVRKGALMLVPLSFIFLLLGVGLGYLAALLNVGPKGAAGGTPDYDLSLAALKSGENLSVRWNGESSLISKADRGVLEIHDGGFAKVVDMDSTQLRNGKLTFHNSTGAVSFQLTVYLNPNLSVTEHFDWRQ